MCHAALWPRNTRVAWTWSGMDMLGQGAATVPAAEAVRRSPTGSAPEEGACLCCHVTGLWPEERYIVCLNPLGNSGPRWDPLAKCFRLPTARHTSPPSHQPEQNRAAVWDCLYRGQWPGAGGGIWPLRGYSLFVSFQWSVFQIPINLIKASGGIQGPHDTWRKDAKATQGRAALLGSIFQMPRLRHSPWLGAAPAALPMTTRGQMWHCLSLLGSRSGL